jgi:hypothetical protein
VTIIEIFETYAAKMAFTSSQHLLWSVPKVGQSIIKSDGLMMDYVRSNALALGTCKISIGRHPLS